MRVYWQRVHSIRGEKDDNTVLTEPTSPTDGLTWNGHSSECSSGMAHCRVHPETQSAKANAKASAKCNGLRTYLERGKCCLVVCSWCILKVACKQGVNSWVEY
jgi:hypothetical protein